MVTVFRVGSKTHPYRSVGLPLEYLSIPHATNIPTGRFKADRFSIYIAFSEEQGAIPITEGVILRGAPIESELANAVE